MNSKMRRAALVVEDDPGLQKSMARHLEQMGFDVFSALHYDAAVDHLAKRSHELVCVDLGLPTQSGIELCEYIRGHLGLAIVPILVTSESGSPVDMANAQLAGANAFLKKPFSMDDFTDYIETLIAAPEGAPLTMRGPHS